MKRYLLLVILLASTFLAICQSVSGSDKDNLNILFILIDDMGYADLGCYGNNEVKTPAIDQLASEGIRFTQYYASAPICSPSRIAVLTGQYPGRWGITSYIDSRQKNRERGMKDFLALQAPSIAKILSDAGYYTAHIGKWHMGGGRDVGDAPLITDYGFDESVSQFEGLGERYLATYETLNLKDSTRQLEKASALLERGEVHWAKRYTVTEKFVDRTITAIRAAQRVRKPFYINLWPDDVHTPLEPSPANRGSGSKHDRYVGVINELDVQLGRIFQFIRNDPRLSGNTMVILASDNGPEPGAGSAGIFRGTKGSLYEGGIREPFIVWCPAKITSDKKGKVDSENVIAGMDLPPSFARLAGADWQSVTFDGVDMSDAFVGKAQSEREGQIMWQRPPDRKMIDGKVQPDLAIREGDFKLLLNTDGAGDELYNLATDPGESTDVSNEYPELVRKLTGKLLSWHTAILQSDR